MLISKEVEVKVTRGNIRCYKEYNCKINDVIIVKIENLLLNSKNIVKYNCDYCGVECSNTYQNYYNNHNKSIIHKDACSSCISKKKEEVTLYKYGVSNISQIEVVKIKKANTCLEHFGTTCNLTTEDTKNKIKDTNLKLYGVENVAQNNIIKEKAKQTNLKRYGCEWTSQSSQMKENTKITMNNKYGVDFAIQSPEIRNKIENTCLKKYGNTNPFKSELIKEKIKETILTNYGVSNISQLQEIKNKKAETFYKNGTISTSRQQEYLYNLLGGVLNYSNNTPSLDIAFPDRKIFIEYNGSGHDLCIKLGNMTEEQFDNREKRRYYYMKNLEWKGIFINSPRDYLPSDMILLEEFNKALKWLSIEGKGHSHYNINIGNKINDINYGKLRRITDKDLIK